MHPVPCIISKVYIFDDQVFVEDCYGICIALWWLNEGLC